MNQRQRLIEQIRQQSIRARANALREAAQRQVSNAPIAAAGASSGGGGARRCSETDGLTIQWQFIIEDVSGLSQRAFLPYIGEDEAGNSVFELLIEDSLSSGTQEQVAMSIRRIDGEWTFLISDLTAEGTVDNVAAQSASLYEGWVISPESSEFYQNLTVTCGDQTYRKLCTSVRNDDLTFSLSTTGVEWLLPSEIDLPIAYGALSQPILIWGEFFGAPGIWTLIEGGITIPGTLEEPPIGEWEGEGLIFTSSAGLCDIQPIQPSPGPVTVITTNISATLESGWSWSESDGSGQVRGVLGLISIDSLSTTISPIESGSSYLFNISSNGPNNYVITLLPGASEQIGFGGGKGSPSKVIVDMILNIETSVPAQNPITQNTGSAGSIISVTGSIEYID